MLLVQPVQYLAQLDPVSDLVPELVLGPVSDLVEHPVEFLAFDLLKNLYRLFLRS